MQYDAADRRTQVKWGDGFYVSYDYDNASEVTAIRDNGGNAIETFGYDDLGRRTSRTAPLNGTGATYGYDGASNLTSLSLSGGGSVVSINPLTYSPADEVTIVGARLLRGRSQRQRPLFVLGC
jgi:YD repeat-containing protein